MNSQIKSRFQLNYSLDVVKPAVVFLQYAYFAQYICKKYLDEIQYLPKYDIYNLLNSTKFYITFYKILLNVKTSLYQKQLY